MRLRLYCGLLGALCLPGTALAQANPDCPVQPATFRAMRDCYRPVLVFSPTAHDGNFTRQQTLLEQYADDMMDRNMLYVPVARSSSGFQRPLDAPFVVLGDREKNAIRQRFHIAPSEFVVMLVGEDGGEKYRSAKPISVLELNALVDAMPMRKAEKKTRASQIP